MNRLLIGLVSLCGALSLTGIMSGISGANDPGERTIPSDARMPGEIREGKPYWSGAEGDSIIVFWAAWCAPCLEELPQLDAAREQFRRLGTGIFSVHLGDRVPAARRYLSDRAITLPTLLDTTEVWGDHFSVSDLPAVVLVDAGGRELERWSGARTPSTDAILTAVRARRAILEK